MSSKTSAGLTIAALLLAIVAVALGGALLLFARPQPPDLTIRPPVAGPPPLPTATPSPTAAPSPTAMPAVMVYVSGAVHHANTIHELPAGSRVVNAVMAAGGMTDSADPSRINLAEILKDGAHIDVPVRQPDGKGPLPTPSGGYRIAINAATLAELQTLPGVGAAIAQRIVDHREQVGRFESLDNLGDVSGIGPASLNEWRDLIAFD